MDYFSSGALWTLFLLILMADSCLEALRPNNKTPGRRNRSSFALVPSQVLSSKHVGTSSPSPLRNVESSGLASRKPTHVLKAAPACDSNISKRSRRRKRPKKKKDAAAYSEKTTPASLIEGSQYNLMLSGNLPDVYWGSISMEQLRQHPVFRPLPQPHEVLALNKLEDVRLFRQDSWQSRAHY